jgi:hypothetical protein
MKRKIKLYELAHARAGDKGEITNISLFPYRDDHYLLLRDQVTAEAVRDYFGELVKGEVRRYEIESLKGFNFVLYGTRPGGVSSALDLDAHGKSLSFTLLELEIECDDDG